jgi:nitroreductase
LNAVIDAIKSRRTVKRMDADLVPSRSDIETIIEAATWAPNHHLTEPWRFVVIEKDARRKLGEALAGAMAKHSRGPVAPERLAKEREKPLSAPVIVVLIGAPKRGEDISPQEEMVAAGAALQNMLLAAHSLGLVTSVRTGLHSYSDEMKGFFGMSRDESLVGMVYVGYVTGLVPPGKRAPFRDRVSWRES